MATKRRLSMMSPEEQEPADPADELMFLCLGGGNEVGRSCHIIQYKGKTVMVHISSQWNDGIKILMGDCAIVGCRDASCVRWSRSATVLR